jgi:hypothetical protein
MSGAISLPSLYAFVVWRGIIVPYLTDLICETLFEVKFEKVVFLVCPRRSPQMQNAEFNNCGELNHSLRFSFHVFQGRSTETVTEVSQNRPQ